MSNKYNLIVIGSGPAGYVAAVKASQLGLKTLLVEKDVNRLGGVCLNEGCIPAKSLYHSAKLYKNFIDSRGLFKMKDSMLKADLSGFVDKSRETSDYLRQGLKYLFNKYNVDILIGEASFSNKTSLKVKTEKGASCLKADNFLIASGSRSRNIENCQFDKQKVLSSNEAIYLRKRPKRILIVGAGSIGCEFSTYFNMIGSNVTLIELADSILPHEDKESAKALGRIFKRSGIRLVTNTKIKNVKKKASATEVNFDNPHISTESFSHILVAVGREPNTKNIELGNADIDLDGNGFIKVNDKLRTSNERVYAAGDVINTPMLAHIASAEGNYVAKVIAKEDAESIDYTSNPNAVYSRVQLASVGITEQKAKQKDLKYNIGKAFFRANGKAAVNHEIEGFVKILAEQDSGKILGAHIVHELASELIHELVVAKKQKLTVSQMASTIHAHPTLSETIGEAARSVLSDSIHS